MSVINPVAAACHADPYPYYRHLQQGPALLFDASLTLWVASRAAVMREVFDNPSCRVRPVEQAVPRAIAGSSAGQVFSQLARMNEGSGHACPKLVLRQALDGLDLAGVASRTRVLAARHTGPLSNWMLDLPTWVVAGLLGFDAAQLPGIAASITDFVRCLSPLSSPGQLLAASAAADALLHNFKQFIDAGNVCASSLLARVQGQAALNGWDHQEAILANLIGLLSQTHEATAGLIANSIVALAARPDVRAQLHAHPELAGKLVREVGRFDAPVQNTRRFVTEATRIAGIELEAGATILLLLGAAGRDGQDWSRPDELLLDRPERQYQSLGFGHGRHACPGQQLALTIAAAALQSLPPSLDMTQLAWTYRDSLNGRLPVFSNNKEII